MKLELNESIHIKTGKPSFKAITIKQLERDEFLLLTKQANKMGGHYSKFTRPSATPPILRGFAFPTKEQTEAFITAHG